MTQEEILNRMMRAIGNIEGTLDGLSKDMEEVKGDVKRNTLDHEQRILKLEYNQENSKKENKKDAGKVAGVIGAGIAGLVAIIAEYFKNS